MEGGMTEHEMIERLIQSHPGVTEVFSSKERGIEVVIVRGEFAGVDIRWRLNIRKRDTTCDLKDGDGHKVKGRVKTSTMDNYDPEVGMGVALLKAIMKTGGAWASTKLMSDLIIAYRHAKTGEIDSPQMDRR